MAFTLKRNLFVKTDNKDEVWFELPNLFYRFVKKSFRFEIIDFLMSYKDLIDK